MGGSFGVGFLACALLFFFFFFFFFFFISLFEAMQGDDPNALIGLPLIRLTGWLNEAGFSIP